MTHLRAVSPRLSFALASVLALGLGVLPAASGCERSNDVPRLQDEARQVAQEYQERFEELGHRAEAISKRGNTLRADALNSVEAQRVYREAMTKIEDDRQLLKDIPTRIAAGVKSDDRDALPRLIDSLRERFEHDVTTATADLAAVESWISNAEQAQGNRPAPPPPPAPSAAGTVQEGAPQPTGSDAPVR